MTVRKSHNRRAIHLSIMNKSLDDDHRTLFDSVIMIIKLNKRNELMTENTKTQQRARALSMKCQKWIANRWVGVRSRRESAATQLNDESARWTHGLIFTSAHVSELLLLFKWSLCVCVSVCIGAQAVVVVCVRFSTSFRVVFLQHAHTQSPTLAMTYFA